MHLRHKVHFCQNWEYPKGYAVGLMVITKRKWAKCFEQLQHHLNKYKISHKINFKKERVIIYMLFLEVDDMSSIS